MTDVAEAIQDERYQIMEKVYNAPLPLNQIGKYFQMFRFRVWKRVQPSAEPF